MEPLYLPGILSDSGIFAELDATIPWLTETPTRSECFMSPKAPLSYTYGQGRGVRTYTSIPMNPLVTTLTERVNETLALCKMGEVNVCFLNRYDNERQHLGWHSDDHPGTDHTRPIVSLSFGGEREIWWRAIPCAHCSGTGKLASMHRDDENFDTVECPTCKGVKPEVRRQLLGGGSLFIMPPGMQQGYQHRIPKGDRKMDTRISLTFRAFL